MTSSVIQRLIHDLLQSDVFVASIEQARQRCQQRKTQATLVTVQLRSSNDHWTGEKGSEGAADMAGHIQTSLRSTDQVFPCGNWKVAILLPNTHIRDAVCLAERLRTQLDEFSSAHAADDKLFTSIGLAQGLARESSRDWITRASNMCDHAGMMGQSWLSFDPATEEGQQATELELHATAKPEAESLYRVNVDRLDVVGV